MTDNPPKENPRVSQDFMNCFFEINAQHGQLLSGGTPVLTVSGPTDVVQETMHGTTAQYVCTANYLDGTQEVVVPDWSVNLAFASIDANGLLTVRSSFVFVAYVTITAEFGRAVATYEILVRSVSYKSLTIQGPTSVPANSSRQYYCIATNWDDTTEYIYPDWWDVISPYATITSDGLLHVGAVESDQNVTITAGFGGTTDTHAITIKPTPSSIVIEGPATVPEESEQQYLCRANWSDGSSTYISPDWYADASWATINSTGLLITGDVTQNKNVIITAIYGGKADTHIITIQYVP